MVCEWFGLKTTRTVSYRFGPQNRWQRFMSGLASKPLERFFASLVSKPVATVSDGLALKPVVTVFSSLTSKLVAAVSPGLASKLAVGFLVEAQNKGGGGFICLGIKIGSYGLVIWTSKSPRWFLGLSLKIKQVSVCRMHHKTDGGWSARNMHRDLAACFT
jgi:hypothetical protein